MSGIAGISGTVAVLAAAVGLAGCATSDTAARAAGSIPTSTPGPVPVYVDECGLDLVSQPRTFTLTCADAGQTLQGLVWAGWGSATATATGREVVNVCEPDCAAGHTVGFPVSVVASRLTTGRPAEAYTRLTVTAQDEVPQGVDRREVFSLAQPGHRAVGGRAELAVPTASPTGE